MSKGCNGCENDIIADEDYCGKCHDEIIRNKTLEEVRQRGYDCLHFVSDKHQSACDGFLDIILAGINSHPSVKKLKEFAETEECQEFVKEARKKLNQNKNPTRKQKETDAR